MKILSVLFVASLLTFEVTAASRARVDSLPRDTLGEQRTGDPLTTLRETAVAPVSEDPAIHQTNPVIASDGSSFLLVWRESTECCFWKDNQQTTGLLYAATLSSRGERIGEPTLISSTATTSEPGVAFDGTNYLFVWTEFGSLGLQRVVGQRFSPELKQVEATPFIIRIPSTGRDIQIGLACGPDDCLAVFDQGHALLSKNGGVLRLSLDTGGVKNEVIATGTGYAAAMTIRREGSSGPAIGGTAPFDSNMIAQFAREGTVSGPFRLSFGVHFTSRISASLATNGSSILIAAVDSNFEHPREPQSPLYFIWSPTNLSSAPSNRRFKVDVGIIDERQPMIRDTQVIWTGNRYLLVYQRSNESFTRHIQPTGADIYGVWIESDGSGIAGPALDLTATDEFESLPTVAVDARGRIALAFVRGRGGDDSPVPRLFVKVHSDGGGRSRPARR